MNKIQEFQAHNGLKPDGILGKNTITKFKEKYNLNKYEVSIFLGELHHETSGFTKDTESLNYSPSGLINTFGYYRTHSAEAWIDGRTYLSKANQKTIANKVYANKNRGDGYKLGNTKDGDGFRYIGRGAIQLTGYNNYNSFSSYINDSMVVFKPELVATQYYWESALYFFDVNGLWKYCTSISTEQINKVTAKINKSTQSYKERVDLSIMYYEKIK